MGRLRVRSILFCSHKLICPTSIIYSPRMHLQLTVSLHLSAQASAQALSWPFLSLHSHSFINNQPTAIFFHKIFTFLQTLKAHHFKLSHFLHKSLKTWIKVKNSYLHLKFNLFQKTKKFMHLSKFLTMKKNIKLRKKSKVSQLKARQN